MLYTLEVAVVCCTN